MKTLNITYRSGATVSVHYDEAEIDLFFILVNLMDAFNERFDFYEAHRKLRRFGLSFNVNNIDQLQVLK